MAGPESSVPIPGILLYSVHHHEIVTGPEGAVGPMMGSTGGDCHN